MIKLPDDVFKHELLQYLTVYDIVVFDNSCLNDINMYLKIETCIIYMIDKYVDKYKYIDKERKILKFIIYTVKLNDIIYFIFFQL